MEKLIQFRRGGNHPLLSRTVIAGIFLALLPVAAFGDSEVAELLVKSGRTALMKGDTGTAIEKFRKAITEDPGTIEAKYWLGKAFEKSGDKASALQAYRDYNRLFKKKQAAGEVSNQEKRYARLSEKRVSILAAGEKEFKKLEAAFLDRLYAYARDNFVRDPTLSLKALKLILNADPENAAAKRLFEKLGGEFEEPAAAGPGPKADSGPFKDVKRWTDLI
jgi:tetratricopeptide (TPR) repeat protein